MDAEASCNYQLFGTLVSLFNTQGDPKCIHTFTAFINLD